MYTEPMTLMTVVNAFVNQRISTNLKKKKKVGKTLIQKTNYTKIKNTEYHDLQTHTCTHSYK